MNLATMIYQHSLHLPEQAAQEVLEFIQNVEKRYGVAANETYLTGLTPEQTAAYSRLSNISIPWQGKPIADRDEANAR